MKECNHGIKLIRFTVYYRHQSIKGLYIDENIRSHIASCSAAKVDYMTDTEEKPNWVE